MSQIAYMGMDSVTNTARSARKTKPKGRHPDKALSAAFVRTAPPGRHADGNGLYLYVQPTGTRSWIQRLVIRGRKRELGLGSVALVLLAEAREQALANRKLARAGVQPTLMVDRNLSTISVGHCVKDQGRLYRVNR